MTSNKRLQDVVTGEHSEDINKDQWGQNNSAKLTDTDSSTCKSDPRDSDNLIGAIGRDNSISCLMRCSQADYGVLASLNHGFRSLIKSGELCRWREKNGIKEHWIYFSCNARKWKAFYPCTRWINMPEIPFHSFYDYSKTQSVVVGTDLLVFGKQWSGNFKIDIVVSYSILTNSWSRGVAMNSPRFSFGHASFGYKAIVAGGSDGTTLSSAELYNSKTQTWSALPSMNKSRKMCSGVFMDEKFYMIGGMGSASELLTCGEEFDPEKGTWRLIPNMSLGLNVKRDEFDPEKFVFDEFHPDEFLPLSIAVVNNELYAANLLHRKLKKYDKKKNVWITLGKLPKMQVTLREWLTSRGRGVSIRGCGERLVFMDGLEISLYSWIPKEGEAPKWSLIPSRSKFSFKDLPIMSQ